MLLSYQKFILTDLITKAFTQKKAISKGADWISIYQLRHDFKNQTGFREEIIPSYLNYDV